jgi:hypothetical protein
MASSCRDPGGGEGVALLAALQPQPDVDARTVEGKLVDNTAYGV